LGLILDTNALSALADGDPAAAAAFRRAAQIAIPVIVLGEFRYGIAQSRHESEYERWLDEVLSLCPALDVNVETARHYAAIRGELKRAGTPIPSNDLWIAALSRQHSLPILSRDEHFDFIENLQRHTW
jgi:tRNA(fMet)-specific endonuclease VapC